MASLELLLLRHGIAQERGEWQQDGQPLPDAERALTPEGRRRTAEVVARLVALDLGCERVLSSPLVRARQTAELAVEGGLAPRHELEPELAPGGEPLSLLQRWLGPAAPERWHRLALVGHEPDLSALAGRLCGAPPGALRLRKAGVALLELPWDSPAAAGDPPRLAGQACLTLLLTPRSLRR